MQADYNKFQFFCKLIYATMLPFLTSYAVILRIHISSCIYAC